LDEKIYNFKTKETNGKNSYREFTYENPLLGSEKEMSERVLSRIRGLINYELDAKIEYEGSMTLADIIIPSNKNPKFIIEIKSAILGKSIIDISKVYNRIKEKYPNVKTILIYRIITPQAFQFLTEYWDYLVSINDLDKLEEIIKNSL
jgi:RecB family endonuclease NucS